MLGVRGVGDLEDVPARGMAGRLAINCRQQKAPFLGRVVGGGGLA